jgi:hypothetical protein
MIPISIDGTDITAATIDGTDVQEITVDGQTVFSAGIPEPASAIALYRFEQNFNDSWNTNDATNIVNASFSTDATEGSFAGDFNNVDADVPFDYAGLSELSILAKIKTTQTQAQFGGSWTGNVNSTTSGLSIGMAEGFVDPAGTIYIESGAGANTRRFATTSTFDDGIYHSVVASFDFSNDSQTIYVDGASEATGNLTIYGSAANFDLGDNGPRTNNSRDYRGLIDNLQFLSKEVTQTEAMNYHNTGSIN